MNQQYPQQPQYGQPQQPQYGAPQPQYGQPPAPQQGGQQGGDNKFVGGLRVFRSNNAPAFVIANLTINPQEFQQWLAANQHLITYYNGQPQIKIQLLWSQQNKPYAKVDDFVPNSQGGGQQAAPPQQQYGQPPAQQQQYYAPVQQPYGQQAAHQGQQQPPQDQPQAAPAPGGPQQSLSVQPYSMNGISGDTPF